MNNKNREKKMEKIIFLGGFPQMIDIVMTARDMGIHTIVVDRDEKSPAKRFANKSYNISTDNIEQMVRICNEEQVNGIFSGFEDFNIHIACTLCKILNLPFYATKEQLYIVTNKRAFKEYCRHSSVPVIEQFCLDDAIKGSNYPYIVKPADSYGSRGITVCNNETELHEGYNNAISVSRTHEAIIEKYIDNDHGVELFYTIVNGNIHLTATADRYTFRNSETTVPLPVAEVFPSSHREEIVEKLDAPLRKMLCQLQIHCGLVLVQALYGGNSDYYVYEMAYRLSGEQHYRLVERQAGVQLNRMMIDLARGKDISVYDREQIDDTHFNKPSINLAVILRPGKIKNISGLEKVFRIDEVISYNLTHFNNDIIKPSGDYSHMLIRVNMVASDYTNLRRAVNDVNQFVHVVSETDEDMIAYRFTLPEGS